MFKPIVCALTLCAMAMSVEIAAAKSGGTGSGMGNSMKGGSMPVARQQYTDNKAQVGFKMKILNCHKYARGNGQGGTVMVTVCS